MNIFVTSLRKSVFENLPPEIFKDMIQWNICYLQYKLPDNRALCSVTPCFLKVKVTLDRPGQTLRAPEITGSWDSQKIGI